LSLKKFNLGLKKLFSDFEEGEPELDRLYNLLFDIFRCTTSGLPTFGDCGGGKIPELELLRHGNSHAAGGMATGGWSYYQREWRGELVYALLSL